ncbi:hypothetical protein J6590_043675 [Homalodisca vitripennis]|nr:hypothetical protein J6590_043675 [Homalodisca vitripennis]
MECEEEGSNNENLCNEGRATDYCYTCRYRVDDTMAKLRVIRASCSHQESMESWCHTDVQQRLTFTTIPRATGYCYTCRYRVDDTMAKLRASCSHSRVDGELVPHADGAAALIIALRYLEQQATATPADIVLTTPWRNYASSSISVQQKTITEFMPFNI